MTTTDILGNAELISRIRRDAEEGKTPHAIIIEGAYGSGKKTLAKYIAMILACENENMPCGACSSCRKIQSDDSPDVIRVALSDGRAQIGVDSIRFVRSDVYIRPNDNQRKIYIIESAGKMTVEAQNAFLKVLEEPPEYAIFILLCESADSLLVTVRSRSTVYTTERFDDDTISQYLLSHSSEASRLIQSNPDAFRLAVLNASGSVGRALENVLPDRSEQIYSLYVSCRELIMMLRKRVSTYKLLKHLLSLEQSKDYIDSYLHLLEDALFDVLGYKLSNNSHRNFFIDDSELEYAASSLTSTFILESVHLLESCRHSLTMNANLQAALTSLASEICSLRSKY